MSLYTLAATATGVGASALAVPAEAEVVYTPAHQIIGRNQRLAIDLNHDGVTDFILQNVYSATRGDFKNANLAVGAEVEAAVVYSNFVIDSSAAALRGGAEIGPRSPFHAGRLIMADQLAQSFAGTTYYFGYWFDVSNGYLGLRFKIDGQVHYGWARISTRSSSKYQIVAALTGYAYETEADTPIKAGTTRNDSTPAPERMSVQPAQQSATTLAALALGMPGLSIWRREEAQRADLHVKP